MAAWALLAVAGLGALLSASATAYDVVRVAGAAYLIVLGLRQLWRSRDKGSSRTLEVSLQRSAWKAGPLTNLLDPKVAVIGGLARSTALARRSPLSWRPRGG